MFIVTTFRALDIFLKKRSGSWVCMCDFWARLESYGHGLLKTGWQGRPDMMGAMTPWPLRKTTICCRSEQRAQV